MVSERDVSAAIGSTAYGSDGESVGTVETFYTDDVTGATTWVSVSSGLLGRKQVVAPAEDATFADGRLQLSVPAGSVSSAPKMAGVRAISKACASPSPKPLYKSRRSRCSTCLPFVKGFSS